MEHRNTGVVSWKPEVSPFGLRFRFRSKMPAWHSSRTTFSSKGNTSSAMRLTRRSFVLVFASVLWLTAAPILSAQTQPRVAGPAPEITYIVSMPQPYTHLLHVEARVAAGRNSSLPSQLDLVMPVWTPGSYLVREFERHVQDFAAEAAGGRAVQWRKVNKNTWRVDAGTAREVKATYRVYANELTVRTNELNDRHAFWNNAALLMYPEGQLNAPSTLRVVPFGDWKVATGLPSAGGRENTFRAENFDILYDSPVEVAAFRTMTFEVRGVPHRIVIDGEGNYDPERLRRDVQKIAEACVQMMGDVPYRDYLFIYHLRAAGGGGLEHLNSTAIIFNRYGFRPEATYRGFLSLTAHEFFHLWNVKRIKPDVLGPFDYTQENYTKLLWVAEGVTNYYENLLLRRAGLVTDKEYLDLLAREIQNVQNVPGRRVLSLEEASFDAWIKYYRQDENSVNSQISYYDKGGLVGMLLDLEIRKRSNGAKSLDDVLRFLYEEFAKKGRNFTPEDFQRVSEQMAGASLAQFFDANVRGTAELDYNAGLNALGLQLSTTGAAGDPAKRPAPRSYLGANLRQDGDRLLVLNVLAGTPAYDQGLNAFDHIIALEGQRVNLQTFNARLDERRPGDSVQLTVFRQDDLRTITIKLGARTEGDYRIVPLKNPTPEQARLYEGWLKTPLKQ
ncbi:MAG: M61 family metallopeptidase [Pyrinomonadaceae bacterium]